MILVDDGLATGATMRAAVKAVRQLEPSSITVAVPVAAPDSVAQLEPLADRIICLHMPHDLYAIGRWYQNLIRPRTAWWSICCSAPGAGRAAGMSQSSATPMRFTLGRPACTATCACRLRRVDWWSSCTAAAARHSPRNQSVARCFNEMGLATLLFDLLTKHEQPIDEITRQLRFDIPLLSQRLTGVIDQLSSDAQLRELRIGLFGASTGAAAALTTAASAQPTSRQWSRAGARRPGRAVAGTSPRRFAVHRRQPRPGGAGLNRAAAARLQCEHQLVVVPGASHLFEEHGTLEEVARLAGDWFVRHLV